MSLQVRVELTLFLVLFAVIGLGYALQRYVMLPSMNPFEREVAVNDMKANQDALDAMAEALGALCGERAQDTEVTDKLSGGRDAPVFDAEALSKHNIDFYFLLDVNRAVVDTAAFAPRGGEALELEDPPPGQWDADHPLLGEDGGGIQGIYLSSAGPSVVASRPIAGADEGQGAGHLVLGQFLDGHTLPGRRGVRSGFRMWAVNGQDMTGDAQAVLDSIINQKLNRVIKDTDEMFQVYATYDGINASPALLLRADTYRDILAKAHDAIRRGLLVQTGIGLTALVVLIVLFRRAVMNPLSTLTTHTVAIHQSNDLSMRLDSKRKDELGILANEFDRMVAELDRELEEQRRVKEALSISEERYALAVRGANDGLWDWDLVSGKIHFSERWKGIHGFEEDEIGDQLEDWFELVHPEDRENLQAAIDAHLKGGSSHFESEHRERHKSDKYIWVLCRGIAVSSGESDAPTRMAGSQTDITLRKLFEEQLTHQALHDSLTSLPNRALFMDRVSQAMRRAERGDDYMFAVLFFDLDRFKVINDSLGLTVGDLLLSTIGERLTKALRGSDSVSRGGTIARFGGDEFVLLLDNVENIASVTKVAERIQEVIGEPCVLEGHDVAVTASVGIAMNSPAYVTPEEVVRNADTAMYRAKTQGKAQFEIFDEDMHSKAMERLQLENDMRGAIERHEFEPYFQPIISFETGRIVAFEALARWNHPERGVVPPVDFIPVAEESDMIVSIGKMILSQACRQTRAWQIKIPGCENLCLSANLSPKEFSKPALCDDIENVLAASGLDPAALKLEITESAIMDNIDFVNNTMKRIRALGIELAIDDFGTGYSSLSYLHRFSMDVLKIDQAFVRDMQTAKESVQIVKTIILLAKALDMKVIAEGIETEEQLRALRDFDCDMGQGYHFAKPLPAEAAGELLAAAPSW